jgi:hypothetical protein
LWNGGKSEGIASGEINILAPIFNIDSQTWLQLQRKYLRGVKMALCYQYSLALMVSKKTML